MAALDANPGLASPGGLRPGFPGLPGIVPPSPPPAVVTATWTGSYARTPTAYAPGPPPLAPLAVAVANTAGGWLFAIVSWRQDAGTTGLLQYPSTVTVSDDVNNFWIPVQTVAPQTGIVRCAVWMAPAARAAEYVFFSPTGYQSAICALVVGVEADCPWYSVAAVASNSANQGTSVSASVNPGASGLFSIGVITHDNGAVGLPSFTNSGWSSITALPTVGTANVTDHSGDLGQFSWYMTTGSGAGVLSGSNTGGNDDYGEVIVTVHGASDVIAFPWTVPDAENWPVLVTEIAAGPVLNANPVLISGTTDWHIQNGTLAAVTWPAYQPWPSYQTLITPSLSMTPSGSATFCTLISEQEPVTLSTQYACLAYAYSVAGYNEVIPQIIWYNSVGGQIGFSSGTTYSVPAGGWTQLTFPAPVFPPAGAAYGAAAVAEAAPSGDVPSSAVLYIGYAGFGPADAYEDTPQDELAWTDISTRNFTQGDIKISRGIQYQQQSLEAGTMTVYLASNDGAMMFGNILSSFWPTIGDTDVPIRLRAIWQQSLTPYYPLFSGYTDDIQFGWDEDEGTWYGYAQVEASDAWSRLTSQLLGAAEQEILEDSPDVYCPLSQQAGTNLASGNTTPMSTLTGQAGAGGATATFAGSGITLAGDPGASCWQSSGTPLAQLGDQGVALGYFPPQPITVTSQGVTAEFWMSPTQPTGSQPASGLTVCTCWSRKGPMWTIAINNQSGAASSTASITVYDQNSGTGTTTSIGAQTFLGAVNASESWQFSVTFTQTSLTAVSSPGGGAQQKVTVSCNLNEFAVGFSLGGNAGPVYGGLPVGLGGGFGFMNIAVYGFAVFSPAVPPARIAAHHTSALTAFPLELDTSRLARIAGYAGATPAVLAMRCLDLALPPAADVDAVTAATDTNGQVVSSYFTNIASSTFAFMFVNGAGALVYRRPLEAYDRASPQWVLGEYAEYPVNANTLSGPSLTPWVTGNGATLTSASIANGGNAGPYFLFAGVFHGNGSTARPFISHGVLGPSVTPGLYYTLSALTYSPQGWATGAQLWIAWLNASAGTISTVLSTVTPLAAGSLTYLTTGPLQAPAGAATAFMAVIGTGTPASTVQFYVTGVVLAEVSTVTAGGAGATAPETPYLPAAKLSSDRALLYNQAILTQYGTSVQTRFSGTSLEFSPTSGVIVIIANTASVNARAGIPYTATIYIDNTAQALPYYLNEPSIEDVGNWVTQTLASPLLRPEAVTITPVATPQAMLMGLGAEIGDTATMRRRPQTGGAPEIQVQAYVSKLSHTINMDKETPWVTELEISPFPQGQALACDDVIHGTLTGGNLLPF